MPPYGFITDIQYPYYFNDKKIHYPENPVVIIGSDGHVVDQGMYCGSVPEDSEVVAYTPVYGALPIGQGLDIAIAALSIRENRIFVLPGFPENYDKMNIAGKSKPLDQRQICCLKISGDGEAALITQSCE
jgi:hypothetical protein